MAGGDVVKTFAKGIIATWIIAVPAEAILSAIHFFLTTSSMV